MFIKTSHILNPTIKLGKNYEFTQIKHQRSTIAFYNEFVSNRMQINRIYKDKYYYKSYKTRQ